MSRLLALAAGAVLCTVVLAAQADDPLTGTWELNVAKSKYVPATMAPQSQTRTYRVEGNQVTAHHTGMDAKGNKTLIEYAATLDGTPVPVKGYPDWDAISMKKVDARTIEFTQYRNQKPTLFGKTIVSEDGKTLTVSAQGTGANGEKVETLAVFDRVGRGTSK